jgi:hypothetical protein
VKKKAFVLIEILFSSIILVGLLLGIFSLMIYCNDLKETSVNMSTAISQARAKLEEIKATPFDNIIGSFNNQDYAISGITNGLMRVEASYASGSNSRLINVRIVATWSQRGNQVIGEGKWNAGVFSFFDLNGNTRLESPVEISTAIAKKQE